MSFKRIITSIITLILLAMLGIMALPYLKGEKHIFNKESHEVNKVKATTKEKSLSAASQLEKDLKKQDLYAYDAKYVVQDEKYKSFYPDMLQALIKNNTNKDIRDVQFGFVAWDKNGLPIKLKGNIDFGKSYIRGVSGDAVNIPAKGKFGDKHGFSIDKDLEVDTFKPIVVSYTDFKGNKWHNPKFDEFIKVYEGKRLKDIKDSDKYIYYKNKKSKTPEKVTLKKDAKLPENLDQKKFDEISKNIQKKSEASPEELEAYIAYLKVMGLLAYLDAYEAMYGLDDIYNYYDIEETNPDDYNFDDYDFSSEYDDSSEYSDESYDDTYDTEETPNEYSDEENYEDTTESSTDEYTGETYTEETEEAPVDDTYSEDTTESYDSSEYVEE